MNLFMELRNRGKNHREQDRREACGNDDCAQNESFAVRGPRFHRTGEFLPNDDVKQA